MVWCLGSATYIPRGDLEVRDCQGLEEGHYRRLEFRRSRYMESTWTVYICIPAAWPFTLTHDRRSSLLRPVLLNDVIRTKGFPKDHNHLSSIADPLDSTTAWDPDAMFDDVSLKENVCFIVSTPTEKADSTSVSSSVSQHTRV